MTNADLKRKLTIGQKITLVYRFKKLDQPIIKVVNVIQTNGVYLKLDGQNLGSQKGSFLEFYPASLVEVDEKGFRLYGIGQRPFTLAEKTIVNNYELLRDKRQEEVDALTDGSTTFWQEKAYFHKQNADYLFGGYVSHGNRFLMRRNFNSPNQDMIYDPKIKGELELEYLWV